MLDHVDRQQGVGQGVDRGDEGRRQHGQAGEEGDRLAGSDQAVRPPWSGALRGTSGPQLGPPAGVDDGGGSQAGHDERVEGPGPPEPGGRYDGDGAYAGDGMHRE